MEKEIKMNMLLILSKNGSVWELTNIGISVIDLFNILNEMIEEKLIINQNYIYHLTDYGKKTLKQYIKSKQYHRNYILYNMKYRINPMSINAVYLPKLN